MLSLEVTRSFSSLGALTWANISMLFSDAAQVRAVCSLQILRWVRHDLVGKPILGTTRYDHISVLEL